MLKRFFLNDKIILLLIFLNSLTIFVQGFDQLSDNVQLTVNGLDSFFTLLFVFEIAVKIKTTSFRRYFLSNWNKVDFVLILLSVPSIFYFFLDVKFTDLHFILIFRISRVFKFFRFFKFIPGIEQLIHGIRRAIKDSILVLIAFFVYNFVISVLSCYLFKNYSPEYFGDPLRSFYSTFKIFTVEGWYEIPEQIVQNNSDVFSFFTKAYFILILITGGIFGLSLVNSIFVDAMVSDNNNELENKVDTLNKKIEALTELIKNEK